MSMAEHLVQGFSAGGVGPDAVAQLGRENTGPHGQGDQVDQLLGVHAEQLGAEEQPVRGSTMSSMSPWVSPRIFGRGMAAMSAIGFPATFTSSPCSSASMSWSARRGQRRREERRGGDGDPVRRTVGA